MKTRIVVTVYDIKWDTDGQKVKLPQKVLFSPDLCDLEDEIRAGNADCLEDQISEYLSDRYGFCHNGFDWCFHQT